MRRRAPRTLLVALLATPGALPAVELGGYLAAEQRLFAAQPADPRAHGANASLVAAPELAWEWNEARDTLTVVPFLRLDQGDPERSHADLREALWTHAAGPWELRAGIGTVFWGVTESRHLVDVVNQTDLVEDIDGEDKLGQPMIDLTLLPAWGTVDLLLLPYFRPRTFPGPGGRLRSTPRVDAGQARYESGARRHHLDLALRWSASLGDYDIGIAWFRGTAREPTLLAGRSGSGEPVLVPLYEQIDQLSLDLQVTKGAWLWKLEALTRYRQGPRTFSAAVGGLEYTFFGVLGTRADLGVLAEYAFDDRGGAAGTAFQNDLFTGLRLALNDPASSELLLGVLDDLSSGERFLNLEASRRLGDRWRLSVEGRVISDPRPGSVLHGLRRDDYLQLELARYF